MSTLDNPNVSVDPSTVSFWPTALRWGVIGGLIMVVYALVGNMTGLSRPSAGMAALAINGIVSIALYIVLLVLAIRAHRTELGGHISFGRAFIVGLVVAVVMGILGAIFNYVYMTMIEPDFATIMIDEMEQMYENMGMSDEQISAAMDQAAGSFEAGTMVRNGILGSLGMGGVISLILAAIMKKNPPEVA
jgi:hypothetical protein